MRALPFFLCLLFAGVECPVQAGIIQLGVDSSAGGFVFGNSYTLNFADRRGRREFSTGRFS